jgi:uncharacterized hydrophobic protein (TIGR00341 family)
MALRLIEMILPEGEAEKAGKLLEEYQLLGMWSEDLSQDWTLVNILPAEEGTEAILDLLEKRFSMVEGFRIILLPVEASIPRPEPEEQEEPQQDSEARAARISREELYADIAYTTELSRIYVVMVVLSSIVAAIGILRGNVAIVIGAMVIAPLLGPNVALALATTLGDTSLARRALTASGVGILAALALSVLLGSVLTVDPGMPEIAARTKVGLGDIALALASGGAGALAFTTGIPTALVGVMVAVALLPPLVTLGLLLGSGHGLLAWGALLLFLTNLICINLAGVTTFLVQGIRPLTWWEADRAKKAARIAILLWLLLLSVLIMVILLAQRG